MKHGLFLLVALMMLQSLAHAADWRHLVTSGKGNQHYVDFDSLQYQDAKVSFWQKTVLNPSDPAYRQMMEKTGKPVSYIMLTKTIDCQKRLVKTDHYYEYSVDSHPVANFPGDKAFQPIVPETANDGLRRMVCTR